jgi:protein-S-isoprenylcysteine O-methyltransferase Ste14
MSSTGASGSTDLLPGLRPAERLFNTLTGLSVLSWAALGLVFAEPGAGLSLVRVCISVLHVCVGALFLLRAPLRQGAEPSSLIAATLSLPASGTAFLLAPPPGQWPAHAQAVFALGTGVAVISLGYLGRCFAVLPALRGLVSTGPYRVIRHPVSAGEALMVLACFLAGIGPSPAAALLAAGLSLFLRIRVEERFLARSPEYLEYRRRVRWRLLPGIW